MCLTRTGCHRNVRVRFDSEKRSRVLLRNVLDTELDLRKASEHRLHGFSVKAKCMLRKYMLE